jgi:hypothetical protein
MINTVSFTELVQIFLVGWLFGVATMIVAAHFLRRKIK